MFQVFTEDLGDLTSIKAHDVATRFFDSFTFWRGIGCWRGTFEKSLIFQIDTDKGNRVIDFAKELKQALGQQAVLVVSFDSVSVLV